MNKTPELSSNREYSAHSWIEDWTWYFQMQSEAIDSGTVQMNRSVWDDYFQKKYGNDSFYSDRVSVVAVRLSFMVQVRFAIRE